MSGIRLAGLTKSYGGADVAAVTGLDLAIDSNCFLTLLGPSGCGKTTTLRMIAGYIKPDAGRIEVGGRLLSSPEHVVPPEQRGMGMVFQNYAIWPHMSVHDNVAFGLKLRKLSKAEIERRVGAVLELVNLAGYESRLPGQLSGGQQQRVALARSIVVEPSILLLDEPLSNLDAKLREHMRDELKQLQRRTGITFVYVTHDQAEALALSDQIAVLDRGRLQQFGPPAEIYGRPANRTVADFMGLINLLPGRVLNRNGSSGEIETEAGWRGRLDLPPAILAGAAIELAVRPEAIRLVPAAADSAFTGRIADQTFLGNLVELMVEVGSGTLLRVESHPRQKFSTGERVAIALDESELSVFARAEPNKG